MRRGILRAERVLLLTLALIGTSRGSADWSMTISPQSAQATSNETIDFQITFFNNLSQDIFFSDFGDGQGITVDLEGNVVGNGTCGPGVDCFVQNLFVTSPDPIDIPAGSTDPTFDLGDLVLGTHLAGDQITIVVKGGPDSLPDGAFPSPAFSETTAVVQIVPEPSSMALFVAGLLGVGLITIVRRIAVRQGDAGAAPSP
ncbi:MAG TPA: PEP-CTERM sorting domain-containing protein [Bryobacteraceae bacterium]